MNTFGQRWKITTYGGSHDAHIGVVIDGCPAGLEIDMDFLRLQMRRRRPGQSAYTTARDEKDEVHITSGFYDGVTTGTPIHMMIFNIDQRSKDYATLKDVYRPSHADFTYHQKYGIRDHRGGGRSSARETACRVAAGAVARMFLKLYGVEILSYASRIGPHGIEDHGQWTFEEVESSPVRCPHEHTSQVILATLDQLKAEGDTCGGIISTRIQGLPVGLGGPIYDKLEARLAYAMLTINACIGFDIGTGFESIHHTGKSHNDEFYQDGDVIKTRTNNSGGIQGGLSNGMPITFRTVFKPISSIKSKQKTVDTSGAAIDMSIIGRHDPCVVPRAVPIVEAMSALVLADAVLMARSDKLA